LVVFKFVDVWFIGGFSCNKFQRGGHRCK
jgi:hypothetical protein